MTVDALKTFGSRAGMSIAVAFLLLALVKWSKSLLHIADNLDSTVQNISDLLHFAALIGAAFWRFIPKKAAATTETTTQQSK